MTLAGIAFLVVLLFVPPLVALPVCVVVVIFYISRAFRPTKDRHPDAD